MCIYLYRKYKQRQQQQLPPQEQPGSSEKTAKNNSTCPHSRDPAAQASHKCELCAAEKAAARKYRWKLLLLLMPGFTLSSLDLTIVATALPFVASHFGMSRLWDCQIGTLLTSVDKFNQLSWIVTSFALTETAFMPVFGQLSDTFGRHSAIQFSTFILTVGSILCAAAPVWPVLLLGRGLQGVGTAGIQNVAMIILADKVSLKEQAVNTSIFQLLNGIGYSVGPVIGGYIVNSNWRYAFVLCAGIGALSMVCVFFLRQDLKAGSISLSHPTNGQTRPQAFLSGFSTLDFGGIFLFIFGIGLIILGTAWGGSTFPWSSAGVIAPLTIGVLVLIAFVIWEKLLDPDQLLSRMMPKTVPLVPFNILRNKDVGLVCFMTAGAGASLFSVFYFIGIYFTLVEANSASEAGINLLYYIPGIGVGVYLAIFLCNVRPRQTFWPLFLGTIVETGAMGALAYAVKSRNRTLVNVMMAVAGGGTGARFMPSGLHLAGMFRDRLAPVYSLLRFALPFGGTLALTIMGSVFQNEMAVYFGNAEVQSQLGGNGTSNFNLHNQAALEAFNHLPPAEQEAVRARGASATMWAFISILPFLELSVLATMGMGNVWISKREKSNKATEPEVDEEGKEQTRESTANDTEEGGPRTNSEVLTGVYLLALLRGAVKSQRRPGPTEKGPVRSAGESEETGLKGERSERV